MFFSSNFTFYKWCVTKVAHCIWYQFIYELKNRFNILYTGTPEKDTFANSEDPEEMLQKAPFHQDLHCLF